MITSLITFNVPMLCGFAVQFADGVILLLLIGQLEGFFIPLFDFNLTPVSDSEMVKYRFTYMDSCHIQSFIFSKYNSKFCSNVFYFWCSVRIHTNSFIQFTSVRNEVHFFIWSSINLIPGRSLEYSTKTWPRTVPIKRYDMIKWILYSPHNKSCCCCC